MSLMQMIRQKSYFVKLVLIISSIIFLGVRYASAQVVHYSFDMCDGNDEVLLQSDADLQGVTCGCGLVGQSASLDGVNDRIVFPAGLRDVFEQNFSLEFYFQIEPVNGTIDILSFSTDCSLDSNFTIRYISNTNDILVNLTENINARIETRAELNVDICWHHILWVKSGLEYSFYLDNKFVSTTVAPKGLSIGKNALFGISNSPCLAVNEERFTGVIDEFKIYDRPISLLEANNRYLFPGEIINRDTTIFVGNSVNLSAGNNCANSLVWSPVNGLSVTNDFNTIATPTESTSYTLSTVAIDGCTQTDTVRINVISDDDISCENLLLPSAFTPNGDGLNETYRISNTFIIESLESFEIFDRWGSRVFVANDVSDGWDGFFNGSPVNPGHYVYKVKYTCQTGEFSKVGGFTVLR
ncbi:MAG: gliding motility-associated C-terminal domain-containing protein [Saprospiraceae bacterium]